MQGQIKFNERPESEHSFVIPFLYCNKKLNIFYALEYIYEYKSTYLNKCIFCL